MWTRWRISIRVFVNDNPIHYFDPDGQELQVGGVVNLSIKDLISLIPGKYRSELVVQDGKVQFKNYNSLPDEVKKYKGVALLQTMISSEKRYKYAVSEIAEGKNRVTGQPQAHKLAVEKEALEPRDANPQNAIRNLSKTERTDLPTGHEGNDLPEEGFDGAVFIRAGTFNRPHQASDDLIMDYPRNNVVYHELFENASRTEGDGGKGRDYQDAHNRAGANGNQFSKEVNGTRDLNSGSANGFDPQK